VDAVKQKLPAAAMIVVDDDELDEDQDNDDRHLSVQRERPCTGVRFS
jgi:hypothetical protein